MAGRHLLNLAGYITRNYSPYQTCERMFFTIENARRIDYVRGKIEDMRAEFTDAEYKFMVASLLMSADAVSNVPAVYGCYLKNFKAKALKAMELKAVHKCAKTSRHESVSYNLDVLDDDLIGSVNRFGANIVYLDPPYNERQYSKNYFPLNMIAMTPTEQRVEAALKGKTGIPQSCFMSSFCKKGEVESSFTKLFDKLKVDYIFVSYNSESLLSKEKMMEIMGKYGSVTVIERDYKRFKSFEYNEDVAIKEYLFCLAKTK
jgi:adenine-specific DNA-methyltransferase